jgi:hypothetical protein
VLGQEFGWNVREMVGVEGNSFCVVPVLGPRTTRLGIIQIHQDIQGVFLKCAEILPTRLWNNVED